MKQINQYKIHVPVLLAAFISPLLKASFNFAFMLKKLAPPVTASTNKTECHNVYETLLKVALNTKNQTKSFSRGKRKI
jgi:hypothetical protein